MTKKEKRIVNDEVENEGFDYTFAHKSSFDEIKDEKFHELRTRYLDARQALADYADLTEV